MEVTVTLLKQLQSFHSQPFCQFLSSFRYFGSLGVAVIPYTDQTDFAESHGKTFKKKPRSFRVVRREASVSNVFDHGDSQ